MNEANRVYVITDTTGLESLFLGVSRTLGEAERLLDDVVGHAVSSGHDLDEAWFSLDQHELGYVGPSGAGSIPTAEVFNGSAQMWLDRQQQADEDLEAEARCAARHGLSLGEMP